MSSSVGVFPVLLDGQSTLTDVDRIIQHLRVKVCVCVRACVRACVRVNHKPLGTIKQLV